MAVSTAMLVPPEILENIFNQIGIDEFDSKPEPGATLAAAARVCRSWSTSALRILWRGYRVTSPHVCSLHNLSDEGILGKYLHLIRRLTIQDQGPSARIASSAPRRKNRRGCPRKCRGVNDHFAFLESDVIYRAESITDVKIRLYEREIPIKSFHKMLPPNMAKLSFLYPISSPQHLDYIQKHASQLESLKYNLAAELPIVQDRFFDFLREMPKLRTLHGGVEEITRTLLELLENNTTLRNLRVDPVYGQVKDPSHRDLTTYLKGDTTFPFLQKLKINTFNTEFADQFLPKLPNLKLFKGELIIEDGLAFPIGFSTLTKLESLDINLVFATSEEPESKKDSTTIPGLIGLYSSCVSLKYLKIINFGGYEKFRTSAAEFQKACAALPQGIVNVRLPYWRDWGRAEVKALVRLRRLQEIRLKGIFDLSELQDWPAAPTLSSVRHLNLEQTNPKRYEPWKLYEVMNIVGPIFPNLRWEELENTLERVLAQSFGVRSEMTT